MQHSGDKMKIKKSIIITIVIIGIIAVAYLIYTIFMSDSSIFKSKINEYEQISNDYESMSHNLKKLKTYEKTRQELINEINQLNILKNIYQEEIIDILNNILEACEINLGKISFSEVRTANINEINNEEIENQDIVEEIIEAQAMTVTLEFSSTYDSLVLFIDEMQNSGTDISITNIKIINNEEGENVQCVITLNFYALPM